MTLLEVYQNMRTAILDTIAWLDAKTVHERDVMIIRAAKPIQFSIHDYINVDTATDWEKYKALYTHLRAPIDLVKITERIDDEHYNMYAYRNKYEAFGIDVHDNSNDQWSHYIPTSKIAEYTNDILAGINAQYSVIDALPVSYVYDPPIVCKQESVPGVPPVSPQVHWTYRNSIDGITYICTYADAYTNTYVWNRFGHLGSFSTPPTVMYVNNTYLNTSDNKTYKYDGSSWVEETNVNRISKPSGSASRTISPLIKALDTEVKMQYVDITPKKYAYPKVQNGSKMYLDIPDYVLVALAHLTFRSNFFYYKDDVDHGDVIVYNLKTLYDTTVTDYETGVVKTYDGALGELVVSLNATIAVLGG